MDKISLEKAIDSNGIEAVIRALAEICSDKAEHIACNWQDTPLAKRWMRLSTVFEAIIDQQKAKGL